MEFLAFHGKKSNNTIDYTDEIITRESTERLSVMKFSAITGSNVEGFSYVLLPEVSDAIRKGEPVGAIGLVDDKAEPPAAAGAIAGIAKDGEFQILSLFVEERYRSRGFGQMLLDIYTTELERFGLPQSLEFLSTSKEHAGLEEFLERNGFEKLEPSDIMFRIRLSDIDDTGDTEDTGLYSSFAALPETLLKQTDDKALAEDQPLPYGGLLSRDIIRECSFGMEKNKELEAYCAVEGLSETEILISAIWCRYPVTGLEPLFLSTIRAIKAKSPPDSYIYMYVENDRTGDLTGRYLRDPEIVSRKYFKP